MSEEATAPGRKQHLGASMTLASAPKDITSISDRVSEVAVAEKGFVASSHVQTGRGVRSEASLLLTIPSAHLSATFASLARLAAVAEETRSSQDITGAYNSARLGLHDANVEREALLRALSSASTEGEIDSLRQRLADNRRAIDRATQRLKAITTEASTSALEVRIVGANASRAHESKSFTLARGLSDAGKVLVVVMSVLLIAAAILVPLAILIAALLAGHFAWRKGQRERALDRS